MTLAYGGPAGLSRQRQSAALLAAEAGARKSRTRLAADLDLSYDQYCRYVAGMTPIRLEQIGAFAVAYAVDPIALGVAMLTGHVAELSWTLAGALHGQITETDIAEFVTEHQHESEPNQRAHAAAILQAASLARAEAMAPPPPTRRRTG